MKVALINPTGKVYSGSYPIGLAIIPSYLRKNCHEVIIIDQPSGDSLAKLDFFKPDLVGITATTPTIYDAYGIAKYCKEKGYKVAMGGHHVSVMPNEAINFCDCVVIGEGERVVINILENDLTGIIQGDPIMDLDDIPMPAYDLLNMEFYIGKGGEKLLTFSEDKRLGYMLTSRGCPYHCSFCHNSFKGLKYRSNSPERIVEEMEHLIKNYGINCLFIIEDNKNFYEGMVAYDLYLKDDLNNIFEDPVNAYKNCIYKINGAMGIPSLDYIKRFSTEQSANEYLTKLLSKEAKFTTADGVNKYNGDEYWYITKELYVPYKSVVTDTYYKDVVYFDKLKNAQQYLAEQIFLKRGIKVGTILFNKKTKVVSRAARIKWSSFNTPIVQLSSNIGDTGYTIDSMMTFSELIEEEGLIKGTDIEGKLVIDWIQSYYRGSDNDSNKEENTKVRDHIIINNKPMFIITNGRWLNIIGFKAFRKQWEKEKEQIKDNITKTLDSKQLIDIITKRFAELEHKEFEWRSFYNGWLESFNHTLQNKPDLDKVTRVVVIDTTATKIVDQKINSIDFNLQNDNKTLKIFIK